LAHPAVVVSEADSDDNQAVDESIVVAANPGVTTTLLADNEVVARVDVDDEVEGTVGTVTVVIATVLDLP